MLDNLIANKEVLMNACVALAAIALVTILFYRGKKKESLMIVANLVQVAEDKFGSGTGIYKYAYVIEHIYPLLPTIVKFFVNEAKLDKWIEVEVNKLQDKLQLEIKK